jgi:metallo-beta-lactamase family protein
LQEEDAAFHARHPGTSSHQPAVPLYTEQDAQQALALMRTLALEQSLALGPQARLTLHPAGHILGSCFADFLLGTGGDQRRILFTGDIGRLDHGNTQALAAGPARVDAVDYLVMESTYGNRRHPDVDIAPQLAQKLRTALERGGVVVIPAFAVERTEKLLFLLKHLLEAGQIPRVPVHIDSPMAIQAMEVFIAHAQDLDADTRGLIARYGSPHQWPELHFDSTPEQSKALIAAAGPFIVLSSSGMATGGRVIHHLKAFAPDPRNTILFAGHQAVGTRGAAMLAGAETIRIHGEDVPVRAEVAALSSLSAHADWQETLDWLRNFRTPPRCSFITHGEPVAADALRQQIERRLGWRTHIPEHGETVDLAAFANAGTQA